MQPHARVVNELLHRSQRQLAISGAEDTDTTDNLSSVYYCVETQLDSRPGTRSYGIESVQISDVLERPCQVIDYKPDRSSDAELLQLAGTVQAVFGPLPDFEISGGHAAEMIHPITSLQEPTCFKASIISHIYP